MNIPRYWARARLNTAGQPDPRGPAIAFGWSDESAAAALTHATERARRIAGALRAGRGGGRTQLLDTDAYYPLDRPLREPVVEEVSDSSRARVGVITRNAYGCYVLNTERAAFVDVDLPPPPPPQGFFARLVGRPPPAAPDGVPERVRAWVDAHPGLGLRLYRTARGYRALVTSSELDPTGAEADELFRGLGADPLYIRLCEVQVCFRARLTPKPWRLQLPSPQTHWFPWEDDPERKSRFDEWDQRYEAARAGRAVCVLVGVFGSARTAPGIVPIVDLHDRWCCGGTGPLV